jgi:methenyltetrahydrofolate cyclohydrolase
MPYSQEPIGEFADAVGARSPAPAAGSATAVAAAVAAALVELAARVSDDEAGAAEAQTIRGRLFALADEDAEAYAAFLDAGREDDRSRTIDVPLEIAEAAADVVSLAARLAAAGKPSVRGDALAAADLARASVLAAARLVTINVGEDRDERSERARQLAEQARGGRADPK